MWKPVREQKWAAFSISSLIRTFTPDSQNLHLCGPSNNWYYLGHTKNYDDDDDDFVSETHLHQIWYAGRKLGHRGPKMVKIHFQPKSRWRSVATLKMVYLQWLSCGLSHFAKIWYVSALWVPWTSAPHQNQKWLAGKATLSGNAAYLAHCCCCCCCCCCCVVKEHSTTQNDVLCLIYCHIQRDWLEVQVHVKDVLKCIITVVGEQCVMILSMTQQQELLAILSDSGTFNDLDKHERDHSLYWFGYRTVKV